MERGEVDYTVTTLKTEMRHRQFGQQGEIKDDRSRQVQADGPIDADVHALVRDPQGIESEPEPATISFILPLCGIAVTIEQRQYGCVQLSAHHGMCEYA